MGINGGMMAADAGHAGRDVNTMGVESVDAAVDTIKAAGGTITLEKMAVPGMGWVAYATDPEGNHVRRLRDGQRGGIVSGYDGAVEERHVTPSPPTAVSSDR